MDCSLAFPTRRPAAPSALAFAALLILSACQTHTRTALDRKSTQGAVLGGLAGAAAGAAIGGHEHRAAGVLLGAASGALVGGVVGHALDEQARELDAIADAAVSRRDQTLVVVFPGDVLFERGSAELSPGAHQRLRAFADSLARHPDSDVVIKGHASAEGGDAYNFRLSEARADNVRRLLVSEGVSAYRLTAVGFGSQIPVASNSTHAGRAANRRVEFEIRPNDALRGRSHQPEETRSSS